MKNTIVKVFLIAAMALAATAYAATTSQGTAVKTDASLGGDSADAFKWVGSNNINPINSTAGFSSYFTGYGTAANAWTLAATVDGGTLTDKLLTDGLSFTFSKDASGKTGTWSVTNTNTSKNATLDLVLSFHAGNNVGSFLFDDQKILAGQTLTGNWAIKWLNNSGNPNSVPTFSNLGIYEGSVKMTSAVPEPEIYAMLLGGLGLLGFVARRKQVAV